MPRSFLRVRDWLSAWSLWLLLAGLGRLPRRRALGLGAALGRAWVWLGLPRSDVGLVNLRIAFPDWSEAERRRVLGQAFSNLGRSAVELAFLNRLTPENVDEVVRIEGLEHLERARRDSPGGVVALSAHFGNWELLAATIALRGVPLTLVHRERRPALEAVMREWRERPGAKVLPRGAAARGTLRALREGRVVAMLLDQDTPRDQGVFVPFFGRLACTRDAPARIAMRTGAPVVPAFIHRLADGERHLVRFQPPLELVPAGADADAAVRENVARMTRAIEDAVRADPVQWTWNHRRFRTQPPGEPHPYRRRRRRAGHAR